MHQQSFTDGDLFERDRCPNGAGRVGERRAAHTDPVQAALRAPDHWQDEDQIANAERVAGAIGRDVMEFAVNRSRIGQPEFRMEELRRAIGPKRAPDSAGRILRLLRQHDALDYVVVNRRQSLYRFVETVRSEA